MQRFEEVFGHPRPGQCQQAEVLFKGLFLLSGANMIKAIPTHYDGHYFRSRLEARWVVYFNEIGVKYEYEPDGYEPVSGVFYLPDMWLPDYKVFAEIKHGGGDFKKAYLMAAEHEILLLEGPPELTSYKLLYRAEQVGKEYKVIWTPVCISHAAIEKWGVGQLFHGESYFDDMDWQAVVDAKSARFGT